MFFDAYARYYDLLYPDKDYAAEAEYVVSHIRKQTPSAKRILELGCGTGAHAEHLARVGYILHGLDLSEAMLARAEARKATLLPEVAARLSFGLGDVRTVRTSETYDAVIALFHVMSYQPDNADLQAMFATSREHLRTGGVFIFDVWYGPAVLADRPVVRVKELEDDETKIIRIAQPTLLPSRNLVDVHYRIITCEKKTRRCTETAETHRMRYLFTPEVELLAKHTGFTIIDSHEWMTGRPPGFDTWNVCFICRT
jgi:SAM-dependent methyltransferase